ncbi:F-box/kelch-repeat protein At3g23880-like [Silene latifolia]|uniref:F-box/kelch-repeat protein At3g23880-like n=1 Tax=Silene latifolia TaxID=37657 RepID=UPI003D781A1B
MGDKEPNNAIKKQVIEQQSYLFDDLITEEILTRLPIKSILQCKSVSKHWYSTLSSSKFANAHVKKSPFSHLSAPVNTLFIKNRKNYYLFSYDDDDDDDDDEISGSFEDNLVKLEVFGVENEDNLKLIGCCNGLICLAPVSCEYFILWNPATRKVHKYDSDGYLERFKMPFCPFVISGFGYASSIDDYKYVRILNMFWGDEIHGRGIIAVHVFSLREKRWRKIDFDIDIYVFYGDGQGILINETLYWASCCFKCGDVIVSFDLGTEKFAIFRYPSSEFFMLGALGECLCKFVCDGSMDILKPPTIITSVSLPEDLSLDWSSEMIGYTRTGKIFVTGRFSKSHDELQDGPIDRSRILALVDSDTESTKYTMLLRFEESINIARYFPSLVSPFPIYRGGYV